MEPLFNPSGALVCSLELASLRKYSPSVNTWLASPLRHQHWASSWPTRHSSDITCCGPVASVTTWDAVRDERCEDLLAEAVVKCQIEPREKCEMSAADSRWRRAAAAASWSPGQQEDQVSWQMVETSSEVILIPEGEAASWLLNLLFPFQSRSLQATLFSSLDR